MLNFLMHTHEHNPNLHLYIPPLLTMAALRPLRSVVPRASLVLHSKQLLPARLSMPRLRHASTTTPPPKPRLLEKPDRFNPPSHGARMRTKPKYYGAPLSHHERTAQRTRRYPHMMPPEGSFMFYFLTDRTIHLFITLVTHPSLPPQPLPKY